MSATSLSPRPASVKELAPENKVQVCGFWHIALLTMSFVLGDLMATWNKWLTYGFWEFILANFLVGSAYICLMLCQAEMTSMLPFSGGSYGFARVTLGPFVGFIVGYMEVLSNFMFTVSVVEHFGDLVQKMMGSTKEPQPVYWLGFYIPALILLLSGSKYFYPVTAGLSVFSLAVIAIYLLGTSPEADFHKYVTEVDSSFFPSDWQSFLTLLPIISEFWLGFQSATLACEDTEDAATVVPRALLSGVGVTFLLSFMLAFSVSSQYPGITEVGQFESPMNYGFADLFHIPEAAATIFSLIAVFGLGLTHMFAYSRQIMALARSRLCSVCFKHTLGISDAPSVAILTGSVLSYGILLLGWAGFRKEVNSLLHASLVFTFIVYLFIFASFLVFKINFSSMQRKFTNPIGYFSVAYGGSVFLLAVVAILALKEGDRAADVVSGAFVAAMFLYYYFVASKTQTYSQEEQHLLLKLYVIKGNAQKRKKKGKKRAQQGQTSQRHRISSPSSSGSGSSSDPEISPVEGIQDVLTIAGEVQQSASTKQQKEDAPSVLPQKLSFAANILTNMKLITRDALAPFSPSFDASPEVHPLPASSKRVKSRRREREDKPAPEVPRGRSKTLTDPSLSLTDGVILPDVKCGESARSGILLPSPLFNDKEDELRLPT